MNFPLTAAVKRTLLSALANAVPSPFRIGDKSVPSTLFAAR